MVSDGATAPRFQPSITLDIVPASAGMSKRMWLCTPDKSKRGFCASQSGNQFSLFLPELRPAIAKRVGLIEQ
jgi:hypothetical protein